MAEEPTSKLSISKHDLDDPDLYRLNQILNWITSQITATRNNGKFTGESKFSSIKADLPDHQPGDNDVVPWGTIKRYLSPAAVRQAFVTNNWFGQPVNGLEGGDSVWKVDGNNIYRDIGQVSIGTRQFGAKLIVSNNSNQYYIPTPPANTVFMVAGSDSGSPRILIDSYNGGSQLTFRTADGTIVAPSAILSGHYIISIDGRGYGTSAYSTARVNIVGQASESWTNTAQGTRIGLWITPNGSTTMAEAWGIENNGELKPAVADTQDIGDATNGVGKVWTNDLNVKQGGSLGDVLTNDGSDNAVWSTPSAGGSTKFARSTGYLYPTTSIADVPGCSVSLDQDGDWHVIGCANTYRDATDVGLQVSLDYNGSTQTGVMKLDCLVSTDGVIAALSQQWIVTVSGAPKTAKLQGIKSSGSGSSYIDVDNTTLSARFIG